MPSEVGRIAQVSLDDEEEGGAFVGVNVTPELRRLPEENSEPLPYTSLNVTFR
jgi:hypothetical protein